MGGVAAVMPMTRVTVPYKPRRWARPFHASLARWSCLVLHRRAGKTTAVINHHQRVGENLICDQRLKPIPCT